MHFAFNERVTQNNSLFKNLTLMYDQLQSSYSHEYDVKDFPLLLGNDRPAS